MVTPNSNTTVLAATAIALLCFTLYFQHHARSPPLPTTGPLVDAHPLQQLSTTKHLVTLDSVNDTAIAGE